jgi:hypothetical protein
MQVILIEKKIQTTKAWVHMATNGQKQVTQEVIKPRLLIGLCDKILSTIYCEHIPASLLSYAVQRCPSPPSITQMTHQSSGHSI